MKLDKEVRLILRRVFLLGVPLMVMLVLISVGLCEEEKNMGPAITFWELVENIENARPYTRKSVESLLGVELELESEHEYTLFYQLKAKKPRQQFDKILSIDLRISKTKPGDQGFLSIDLSDSRISFEEVKSRYPDLTYEPARPGPPPQGLSPESANYLSVERSWGSLSFGFLVKNPKVLARIIFSAKSK